MERCIRSRRHSRLVRMSSTCHKRVGCCAIALLAFVGLLSPLSVVSHETTTTTVLFDREIVRILNQHCVTCHSEGSLSFPLSTYEQTWLRGRAIRSEVLRRHMPPWSAVPGYGQFANDNSLTLRELQFMVSWVEGLGPRNAGTVFLNVLDPTARPAEPVRAQPHRGHWQLGQPAAVLTLPNTTIEAGQPDHVQRVVVETGFRSARRLRAVEYMPGDYRVVRAAFFTVQETGQWISSWTPWYGYSVLPENAAVRIPAGAHIVAEIHYRGAREAVEDRGALGLFFNDRATVRTVGERILEAKGDVRAGASQPFRAQTRLASGTSVLALRPEVSEGTRSIEVAARKPDGSTQILLFAKDLRPEWPTPYILKDPLTLPAGTLLSVTTHQDNTSALPKPGGFRVTVSTY